MFKSAVHKKLCDLSDIEIFLFEHPKEAELEFIKKGGRFTIQNKEVMQNDALINMGRHPRFLHVPEHKHDYIEMVYVYQGSLKQRVERSIVTLKEGDIFLLNQNIFHEIFPAGKDDIILNICIKPKFFYYLFSFIDKNNVISQLITSAMYDGYIEGSYLHCSVADNVKVKKIMFDIIEEFYSHSPNSEPKLKMLIGLLFIELLQNQPKLDAYTVTSQDAKLSIKVLSLIDSHFMDINLESIAEITQYPQYRIARVLKEHTGMTFKQLLQEKRLEKAAEMLTNTRATIEEIISTVGYDNASYFYKIFKNKFGVSLNSFRKNHDK
ncbi:AraC family transcriptional regulator [Brenneria tiliae]|uniref:AraC family transcriptional regulator n=1 Tax=Brenneria tiliae TaxID=2914984 RepID=A0ABT0MWP7_9GAMM|nr:AraC family transcriptional regulator [Brenneria tiliae]MCL2894271.1 AraC family transcriptional regulator [Brenneria tiliae]MCL2898752.1 AraC family transcriptional regulator [Brenneria tiliae]MCL2903311.1 AraC family transcriptional regulator [Brenneria tiliae]